VNRHSPRHTPQGPAGQGTPHRAPTPVDAAPTDRDGTLVESAPCPGGRVVPGVIAGFRSGRDGTLVESAPCPGGGVAPGVIADGVRALRAVVRRRLARRPGTVESGLS
jgi:hypothetical protein